MCIRDRKNNFKKVPGLTVILIGEMAPSQIYVRNKEKSAREVGLKSEVIKYPESIEEKIVLEKIEELNKQKIKLKIIGKKNFSTKLNSLLRLSEKKTSKNKRLQINLALNYGSKAELISAFKELGKKKN